MTEAQTELYQQVYDEYLEKAKDPAWKFAMEVFIGELMQQNATYHQAQIQAICDWAAERQLNRTKTSITKRYIAEKLEEVQKAKNSGPKPTARPSNYDGFQETMWQRNRSGQFARFVGPQHVKDSFWNRKDGTITPPHKRGVEAKDYQTAVSRGIAQRTPEERSTTWSSYGLLNKPQTLPANVSQTQHSVDVAHTFDRLTYSLAQKTGNTQDKQRVQFVISSPDGFHRVVTPEAGKMPNIRFSDGERVSYMTPVGPDNPVTIAGQAVNIGHVTGMDPEHAAKMGAVAQDVQGAIGATSWGDKLTHTSNALRVMNQDSTLATQAHAVASLFNILGPDASRAFGMKLKQLTYRYLGQEAPPERYSDTAKRGRGVKSDGSMQSIRDYERQLATDLVPSIPSSTEYNLALQAGSSPPSRGYILNSDGRVVSEAVGYADDWYTPFNLRKLPQMRGGSYVRTRGYGGLTPEDVRIAQRTGAKRVTVISNNGVFTMEFEPKALHWGHRFGFAGNGMIKRYAKALDAIQHNHVAQADGQGQKLALDTQGYVTAMRDLQMKNPYYVTAPNDQVPFHQSLKEFGNIDRAEVIGEAAKDKGYMGPLDLHAKKAMGGWHDPNVRDIWTSDKQKYAYTEDQRTRLHHDMGLRLVDQLNGKGGPNGGPGYSGGNTVGGPRPTNGGGGGGSGYGTANTDGELGRNGIRRGNFKVDTNGFIRDWNNRLVDHNGREVTHSEAVRNKRTYESTNPELSRPGTTGSLGDGALHSSRPATASTAASTPSAGGTAAAAGPVSTLEQERRERSHHWSSDDAVATGQDVRAHLRRMYDLGLVPTNTSHMKELDLAVKGTIAPGDHYAGTTEYADFIDRLQVSPSYRVKLAAQLHDVQDGKRLSDEHTQLEPGELFATLRGQEYDPAAVSPAHAEKEPDEAGDNYASIELDGERPVLPSELANSRSVQQHVRDLEAMTRNGTGERAEKAKRDWKDYKTYRQLTHEVSVMRKADSDGGRRIRTLDEIFAKKDPALRELFVRLNRQYSGMIQHGTQVESENAPTADHWNASTATVPSSMKSDPTPAKPHLRPGTGTDVSHLPHTADLESGNADAQTIADSVWGQLSNSHEGAALDKELDKMANRYWAVARAKNSQQQGSGDDWANVGFALDDYKGIR